VTGVERAFPEWIDGPRDVDCDGPGVRL